MKQRSERKVGKTLAVIGVFAICVLFIAYYGVWSAYKQRLFDSALQNMQDISELPSSQGITMYTFPVENDAYSVMMYDPTMLRFNGSYDVSQNVFYDAAGNPVGDCQCLLRVRPSLFHEPEYEWWITDWSNQNQTAYHFKTTKSMEIVENNTAYDPQTAIRQHKEQIQAMLNLIDVYFAAGNPE